MISFLKGKVLHKVDDVIVLDVNDVGYEVHVGASLWQSKGPGDKLELHIHHHVREDAQTLYGFAALEERQMFRKLISVSGIGPKSGLAALSAAPLNELAQAIHLQDHAVFQAVPGIGPKTAQRLVLELKSHVDLIPASTDQPASIRQDVIEALEQLGYSSLQIRQVVANHDLTDTTVEEALKLILKQLSA